MKVKSQGNALIFEGILNENTNPEELKAAVQKIDSNTPQVISLDFSKVVRANSSGIVLWLRLVKSIHFPFKYVGVPVWLVEQFNMISGYLSDASFVESIEVPFFCPETEDTHNELFMVGKDIPLLKNYADFRLPDLKRGSQIYEMDCDPKTYFRFLAENFESFKGFRNS